MTRVSVRRITGVNSLMYAPIWPVRKGLPPLHRRVGSLLRAMTHAAALAGFEARNEIIWFWSQRPWLRVPP